MGKQYFQFLHSPEWRLISEERKRLDGNKCSICGSTEELEVHHLEYENDKRYGILRLSKLTTLCHKCHQEEHGFLKWCGHCAWGNRFDTEERTFYLCLQEKADEFGQAMNKTDGCEYFAPWPDRDDRRTHWTPDECIEHIRRINEERFYGNT